ncbi:TMEM175 family protein [Mucilaginibacter sp. OK098]|uniref:TMEM175 family protein n=1 Tax=Mucilaginibacter sp. OK098 TaxID=1855297 RepID=UPI000913152F|nr:TMEM175 family protein [Mucilaginibacter sp. OK098]SHM11877.1 Uncharacterized membrane protein [Mucilaginibacter sp. OK098]
MDKNDEQELKKEFQLERIIFFSDAVFAIIITIMILDVKLPEMVRQISETESKNVFEQIWPKLVAYSISFFVIGSFWMGHLRIFSFLKNYNMILVAINLLFLFSVSLFPFALSFALSSSHLMHFTWGLYTYIGIICFTFFTQTILIGYLVKNKEDLCVKNSEIETALEWKIRRLNLFIVPVFIILAFLVTSYGLSYYIVAISFIIYVFLIKRLKKKYYPNAVNSWSVLSLLNRRKTAKHAVRKTSNKKLV